MNLARLLQIAIRNAWRNPRRSLLTGILIAMGVAALIFVRGLNEGMLQTMISQTTDTFLGSFKVYHQQFPDEYDVEKLLPEANQIIEIIGRNQHVRSYTRRVMSQGMLSSSADVSTIQLIGIDSHHEHQVSKIKQAIISGQYLSSEQSQDILIGKDLAERLDAQLGDRLVVTVSAAGSGEIQQELFRLSGIFEFRLSALDESSVFINLNRAQSMLNLGDGIHEIVLQFHDINEARNQPGNLLTERLQSLHPDIQAGSWYEEYPSLSSVLDMSGYMILILGVILFAMICLSLMNTLFMSIYERFYEFGVLSALGTKPGLIFQMIVLETAVIASIGCFLGIIFGGLINWQVSIYGIDYGNVEMMNVRFYEPIRSVFRWSDLLVTPIIIWILTVLVSFYPAGHAIRVQTLDAMRHKH